MNNPNGPQPRGNDAEEVNPYAVSEYDHDDDADDWQVCPEICDDVEYGHERARRYSVTFWDGHVRCDVLAWVVGDRRGRVFVVVSDTLLFVCGCMHGHPFGDVHTGGRYQTDEGWILAALEEHIRSNPGRYPPAPRHLVDGPPPRSVWVRLLDDV